MKKLISILGSTGSIGQSTLKILDRKKNYFKPYLFSGIKWFFLYFLTFFPITLYETIQKVRGSVRPE